MKFIYNIFKLFLALGMLVFGILLIFFQFDQIYGVIDEYYEQLLEYVPETVPVREIVAAVGAGVGLLVLLSLFSGGKKKRAISFAGMHGEVTIELEHVESTLERVAMKLPEVKSATIRLEPTDSPGRARVVAHAVLLKNADDDARMVTARVQHYIQTHTKKILGLQDVEVRLIVKRFLMNMKTVKPEPLLLEGPFANPVEANPVEATTPVAAAPEEPAEETLEEVVDAVVSDSGDELELERESKGGG